MEDKNQVDIMDELKKASEPLVEFLNRYYDPHTTVLVSQGRVDIVRGEMGFPTIPLK